MSSGRDDRPRDGRGERRPQPGIRARRGRRAAAPGRRLVVASVGTDGIDGPTDAAGAIADSTTIARAPPPGCQPARHLADNNAYAFFDALGDLIHTGPTGTNVGDLQVILIA